MATSGGRKILKRGVENGRLWCILDHYSLRRTNLTVKNYTTMANLCMFCALNVIGKPVDLCPEAEEVATFYARYLDTDHVKKAIFNENFFKDFRKTLKARLA